MKGCPNVFKINSRVTLEIPSTTLEKTLEKALAEENKSLNSGIIENSIKHDYHLENYVFLRRVTRPNKLGHNLIYLRWLGLNDVNINNLIKTGLSEFGNQEEYICIGSCKSKEYYDSIQFNMEPKGYRVIFNGSSLMKGFKINGWQQSAINVAIGLDKEIIENPYRFIAIQVSNGKPLKKIIKELNYNYLEGDYKVYKKLD